MSRNEAMPTEKEIEAALAAWDSIPRHKDLDGRQRMKITITWRNDSPDTIWAKLAERLGREPTDKEAANEVRRIFRGKTHDADYSE